MGKAHPAIEVVGLSKTLGRQAVLRRVDLTVAEGETVALVGSNGAGKSTLLRCLGRVIRPTSGEVRWFGHAASADHAMQRRLGLLGHDSLLYPHLSVRENLAIAARLHDVADAASAADRWLTAVGLTAAAHRFPPQISRGMRQRVALARALIHQPPIVLLDEPYSGLDTEAAGWLTDLLRKLKRDGRTICFASHDRAVTLQLADRVLKLAGGRLLDDGKANPPSEHERLPRAA